MTMLRTGPCRCWESIRISSTLYHARQRLPRAVSAREAIADLPVPDEPLRAGVASESWPLPAAWKPVKLPHL